MIYLQVRRNTKLPVDKSVVLHAAQVTLDLENVNRESSLSIVIGDDAFLKKLNQKYRNTNTPTDVLSFPSGEQDPDTNSLYLGDVIISLPLAEHQAVTAGHSLSDELQLLVVHGTLHLLGYDHIEPPEKIRMQSSQDRILSQLGINLPVKL
jgi:probable rRNA maturation factor